MATAASMKSGSANSTYAYLQHQNNTQQCNGQTWVYRNAPLRVTCELVTKDGDPVDGPARLEVLLDFFWGCRVVNLSRGVKVGGKK